jgi:type IV pilus assembly protein PilW
MSGNYQIRVFNVPLHLCQAGVTLVELMISIVIGLIVTNAAVHGYTTHIATQQFIREMTTMNENGRFAITVISNAMLNAGSTGCPSDAIRNANNIAGMAATTNFVSNIHLNGQPAWFANYHYFIEGLPENDVRAPVNQKVDSDVLIVHGVSPEINGVVIGQAPGQFNLSAEHRFEDGEPLLLLGSDCRQAAMFEMTAGEGTNVVSFGAGGNNCRGDLTGRGIGCIDVLQPEIYTYLAGSEIVAIDSQLFYVNDEDKLAYLGTDRPDEETVLVDNVVFARFRYGIDLDEDDIANTYLAAENLTVDDYQKITSVDMALVLRSENEILPQASTKACAGEFSPSDRYLKSCYRSRINLRNRGGSRLVEN